MYLSLAEPKALQAGKLECIECNHGSPVCTYCTSKADRVIITRCCSTVLV